MKIYDPLKKEAARLEATPHETKSPNTGTVAATTAAKQASNPKFRRGSSASEYGIAGNGECEEIEEPGPPVQAAQLDPGEFPIHALSPDMRVIVEDVANVYRVPLQLPAMCAVAIVSGALGNAFTLTGAVNGKECHGNLYVIPAAPKSSFKGSVAGALMPPFLSASAQLETAFKERELPGLKADKAIFEKRITVLVNELATNKTGTGKNRLAMGEPERLEARRELESAQARMEAIELLLDSPPTYWVGNATSEAMARQFKRNNLGLLCYSPEGGETVRVLMGKYRGDGKADYDLALSGYSVEPFRSDRIGRGVCQITPCLTMLLLVQPCILLELMADEEALERGMTARCLPFTVKTEPQFDDGVFRQVREESETRWGELIRGILARRENLAGKKHCIVCTPEAREVFRQFHNESVQLRKGQFRDIEAELGRWRENAIRLAIGQCVADSIEAQELTGEQARRAVEIMRWCAHSALQVTNEARLQKQSARADELQDILARRGGKETLRNLNNSHGFKPEEVRALAGQFPDRILVELVANTGGRPSEIARLKYVSA